MTLFHEEGYRDLEISEDELLLKLQHVFNRLGTRNKVLIIPPDFTRFHSKAGVVTQMIYSLIGNSVKDIIPALGTHTAMSDDQITKMFGNIPKELFRVHNWRNDTEDIGEVPSEIVNEASGGFLNVSWPVQINKLVVHGEHDLIISIGQVVPHEVMGMANYNKNILIGVGGKEAIDYSHFIGAAYGMERMMGKADNPLRRILNFAADQFLSRLPILYILTVIGQKNDGSNVLRGLYVGDDISCFDKAASLSKEVNINLLPSAAQTIVAFMDKDEFRTTWLANKAIYRTRMAIEDGGRLFILAPGVKCFGEDPKIDRLIRKYGYRSTPEILKFLESESDLKSNLSAVAHLIHGSTEGRFNVIYCLPEDGLSRDEIENVGYNYMSLEDALQRYNPAELKDGWNMVEEESVFFISKPALGLWSERKRILLT